MPAKLFDPTLGEVSKLCASTERSNRGATLKEYWFPVLTATSPILQETTAGKTWLQLGLEE
ncbi:MAG: hypothetical protein DMG67_01475, partial [Acidobacteria bacterium]